MNTLSENEIIGKADGEEYSILPWFISGIFFGFFALLAVYFMKVNPDSPNYSNLNSNTDRSIYFHGYKTAVRKKRFNGVILGWLLWLLAVIYYYSY